MHFPRHFSCKQRPFIELEIRRAGLQQSRDKRSTSLDCSDESAEHRCCRFPLEVDFEEMGWDWIIAPKLYRPYYCSGDCPFVFQPLSPHTHITYQHADRHRRLAAGPCCTPAKMSSISMLYFDERGNIIYATLPKMVADQCGCG
jgi:growth differentiation factor 8/11